MPIPQALVERQKRAQAALSGVAGRSVARALPDLSKLSQNDAGGVLRTVATGSLDTFAKASTAAAVQSYDEFSAWAVEAKIAKDTYRPQVLPTLTKFVSEAINPLVGQSMVSFQQGAFEAAADFMIAGLMRYVQNAYRETIAFNSSADKRVIYYQRVASADACPFCALIASTAKYSEWANDDGYHDHCDCSTVPVFAGDDDYRPDYYSTFEDEVATAQSEIRDTYAAAKEADPSMRKKQFFQAHPDAAMNTKNIVNAMRRNRT